MRQQANEFKANITDVKNIAQIDLESINSNRIYDENEPVIIKSKNKKDTKEQKQNKKNKISIDESKT